MVVHDVNMDSEFSNAIDRAGTKVVIADFYATWCGPCRNIAPIFDQLSNQYSQAVFIRIDVDKCRGTMESQGVTSMPTFIFYVSRNKVDMLRGADGALLEQKVRKWAEGMTGAGESSPVEGQINLNTFIDKSQLECLNGSDDALLPFILNEEGAKLISDCDCQLIINIPFNQPVKVHSVVIKGSEENGPKTVKFFINLPHTLDFDKASETDPVQMIEYTAGQIADGQVVNLRYVKFQNVQSMQLFIENNVGDCDVTVIDSLKLFGTPISNVNMHDFKRVAGKKGEAGH